MDTVAMATGRTVGYVYEVGSGRPGTNTQTCGTSLADAGNKPTASATPRPPEVVDGDRGASRVQELHPDRKRQGAGNATSTTMTSPVVTSTVSDDRQRLPETARRRKPLSGRCSESCGLYVVNPVRFMNNRARPGQAYVPTKFEHIANMVTHGLIIAPAILGLYWMLSLTTTNGQYWSALVYGAATLALFITSTTFHTLCYHTERFSSMKELFHYGDRAIIYIFIAASYTPWLILKDYHAWETLTLWMVWIMAAAGILYQYTFHERYKSLETLLYVIIGVCPSIVIMAMKETTGLYEMALGGMVYIIGVVFFKCDGLIPFAHAIWHCFVFVGAVFHYVAVCKHLLGTKSYMDIAS